MQIDPARASATGSKRYLGVTVGREGVMRLWTRLLRNDEGVEAVEFALVVPILLMLISGIVNLGFAFNAATMVTTAVRDGARVASLGGTVAEICQAVWGDTSSLQYADTAKLTITSGTNISVVQALKTSASCNATTVPASGDTATVTLSYTNKWLIPIVFTNDQIITKSSQMRIE